MKILRIALKNLNSLCGEHVVDLEEEPLASAGLFAITGATGAGKSTLLDAITLALYGRAARYGKEPNPGSMMSRHCGECSAEVTFSVLAGRYRAEWKLRRAGGKADGKLQPPQRYIYDSGEHDEQVLAQKIREADEMIEALKATGLAHYKIPARFIAVTELPRVSGNKIDKKNLLQLAT